MNEYDNNKNYIKKEDEQIMNEFKNENELQNTPEPEAHTNREISTDEPVFAEPIYAEANYAETLFSEPSDTVTTDTVTTDTVTTDAVTTDAATADSDSSEVLDGAPPTPEYHYQEEVKQTPKRKKTWSKFVAACLIVSVAGGASIGGGYAAVSSMLKPSMIVTTTTASAQKTSSDSGSYSTIDIVKSVRPSVVSISTTVTGTTQYFGSFSVPYESSGAGSGVIFYSDETRIAIATNNHVVEGATSIYATIGSDITVPASVVGTNSQADLAVLSVSWDDLRAAGVTEITVAVFGDSDALQVGEDVIAIGNAMGMGISATNGIISMTEQTIAIDETELTVLQTSAAINSGNSGGALVNSNGEVIGINTAKYNSSMAEGMGYAIPSNVITPIIEELLQNGTKPSPYIGIRGTNITTENAELYKLPVGALIMEVTEGGPAQAAGLKVGDVVTKFNGQTIMDMESLSEAVGAVAVGDSADIHIVRNGDTSMDLTITIGDKNSIE